MRHVRVDAVGPGAGVQAGLPRFFVPRGDDQDCDGVVSLNLVQGLHHLVKVREDIACPPAQLWEKAPLASEPSQSKKLLNLGALVLWVAAKRGARGPARQ